MRFTNETEFNLMELETIFQQYRKFFPRKSVEIYEETHFLHDFDVKSCNIIQKDKGKKDQVLNIELLLSSHYDEKIRVMFFNVLEAKMNITMMDPDSPKFSEGLDMIYCTMLERKNGKNSFECLFSSESHFFFVFEKIKITRMKE